MHTRNAFLEDVEAIIRIYNQGIIERVATFETRLRSAKDIQEWFDGIHPIIIVEKSGRVIGFASTSTYRPRDCYSGIAEFSVYVERGSRKRGVGETAMRALIEAARDAGYWKLVSRIFPENKASRALMKRLGFREVGIYKKHGKLEGVWRDVIIVEFLIDENSLPDTG